MSSAGSAAEAAQAPSSVAGSALRGACAVLRAVIDAAPSASIVLVDGRSGAGKSTLASMLVAGRRDARLVRLDDVYPGWGGLDAGVDVVNRLLLIPVAAGEEGCWQAWDWKRGVPSTVHSVAPSYPLVVEGSGILTPGTARSASVRVWLEAPDGVRRRRALARDGAAYRPYWERWAAQEQRHIVRDRPRTLATHVFAVP